MRSILSGVVILVAVFLPVIGKAQVFQPTPSPNVTVIADWQLRGEPVFFAGDFYDPAGPNVFFDGFVMVRSGIYQGVPLYVDTSIEPYSIVYVPVGRNLMRPYERRRAGDLPGSARSRTPSFPIERDDERSASVPAATGGWAAGDVERHDAGETARPVGTTGDAVTAPRTVGASGVVVRERAARSLQSIPAPRSNAGIWLEFNGARWYSSGAAVPHVAATFVQIGTYRAFPVYRDATRPGSEVYIPSVEDGPLAPYSRR